MIYDTTFKNLIVDSFDRGSSNSESGAVYTYLSQSLLIVYEGQIPTFEQFVSDWDALYKFARPSSSSSGISSPGSAVLLSYGSASSNGTDINIQRTNNEFYMDQGQIPYSIKIKNGNPGFAVLFPYSAYNTTNFGPDNSPYMILSVSDTSGSGIVKLSTMDLTVGTPTLHSIEFEVNMGA
jgi:hypothetical protein